MEEIPGYQNYKQSSQIFRNQAALNRNIESERNYKTNPDELFVNDSSMEQKLLTNVALQYGSSLMDTGKHIFHKEIDKFFSTSWLKYYFSVDSNCVMRKLILLIFPYRNYDWSLKFVKNVPLTPRFDINAPDLYIPLMGYLTYILLGSLFFGSVGLFSPNVFGTLACYGFIWTGIEILIQSITIYFINSVSLPYLDILSYSGYKFVGVSICILMRMMFSYTVYVLSALYFGLSSAYYAIKFLKPRLMFDNEGLEHNLPQTSNPIINLEYKRKIYFLLMTGLSHCFQIWWLTCISNVNLVI